MKKKNIKSFLLLLLVLVVVNIIAVFSDKRIDFTEDRRYTISDSTIEMLDDVNDVLNIKIYLTGSLPASFQKLKNETYQLLRGFRRFNANIEIIEIDPNHGSTEDKNSFRKSMRIPKRFNSPSIIRRSSKLLSNPTISTPSKSDRSASVRRARR